MADAVVDTPTVEALSKKVLFRPSQKQEMQESIAGLENMLKASTELAYVHGVTVDRDKVEASLARGKRMLEEGLPPDYAPGTKNRLFAVMKHLEQTITYDMPTMDDMERPTPANIDKHMSWEKAHKKEILAWRTIRRILDPNNDGANFTSIEALRTNTPPKGDPRRYFSGFDQIQWEDEQTQQLAADIDDNDYLQFLQLKILRWTEATICKKLSWTPTHYETAMQRFRAAAEMVGEALPVNGDGHPVETATGVEHEKQVAAVAATGDEKPWPMAELEKRGLDRNNLQAATKIASVRLYALCSGHAEWKPEERAAVEKYLSVWDKNHAFVAKSKGE